MELELLMAAISGETLLGALWTLVIWGGVLAVLWWGLSKLAPPAPSPVRMVGTIILVILTCVVLINILLSLDGKEFIKW